MTVLRGTSRSRFPSFDDPNSGIGQLLDRAQQATQKFFKQSEGLFQDSFVEDGAEPVPAFSFFDPSFANIKRPTRRATITQAPRATIFIKKRMFSTLSSNFDVEFMSEDELLFLRAAKLLFSRKCEEIAFYESLISLEGLLDSNGFLEVDTFLDDYLDSFFNVLEFGFGVGGAIGLDTLEGTYNSLLGAPGSEFLSSSMEIINKLLRLREINRRSRSNKFTTWIVDPQNYDFAGLGPGTGVIELNSFASLNTTTSIKTGGGSCGLTIEDPYRLMLVNEGDVEIAIRSAASLLNGVSQGLKEGGNLLIRQAELLDRDLNSLRAARGVSQINFELGFKDVFSSGVIVETQERFRVDSLDNISHAQQLNLVEAAKAKQILSALDNYTASQAQAMNSFKFVSQDLTPLRKRMRKEFLGQSIIQNMDAIHIFVNSNTRIDTPNYTGSVTEQLNSLQNKNDSISNKMIRDEWEALGEGAIPLSIYQMIRKPDVFRGDGVSVFAGLVNEVGFSYDAANGKFLLSIGAEDNTKFLSISRFNVSPSLKQSEGILEDPLTPFELETDKSSGLLKNAPSLSLENQKRLSLLRFDTGPNAGALVRDGKKLWVDKERIGNESVMSFQHVPGLIYKWKRGIVSASLDVNSRETPDGSGSGLDNLQGVYGVSVISNPFSGLDSADIVSILTTGQPYNYSAFLQNSFGSATAGKNNASYFNSLFDFFGRQRAVYGKFIPAKTAAIDPTVAIQAFEAKQALTGKYRVFSALQAKLAAAQDRANTIRDLNDQNKELTAGEELQVAQSNQVNGTIDELSAELLGVMESIQKYQKKLSQKNVANPDGLPESIQVNMEGNDAVISVNQENVDKYNRDFSYMVKRKPEDVRYNEDKNFFLVSDKYDYDTDIQAFTQELKSQPGDIFHNQSSDYKTSLQQCKEVASQIDFEFFADTQGNIVFRPPEYNKTPLSLLLKMLRLGDGDGTNLAPEFLQDLFRSRVDLVKEELIDRDLAIKEKLILGNFDVNSFGIELVIVDDENATKMDEVLDNKRLADQAKKAKDPAGPTILDFFKVIDNKAINAANAASVDKIFDGESAPTALILVRSQIGTRNGNVKLARGNVDDEEDLSAAITEIESYKTHARKVVLVNDIAALISKRQFLLRTYGKLVDQANGYGALTAPEDEDDRGMGSRDLYQNLSSWAMELGGISGASELPQIPKFLRGLIENDFSNDDGWRSGKRFIINDDVILNMSLKVQEPDFNRVNVVGNNDFIGKGAAGLGSVKKYYWAGATDFDSWRQFGHRVKDGDITRADFSNAETQLAPYAVFHLLRQQRKIHSGSITVVGNEFYQPGDVVYVNNKSMLYYVEDVKQNLNFSGPKFTTDLTLTYGHTLGDYIPTPLDVIGKGLLSNHKHQFGKTKALRDATPSDSTVVPLETLFVPSPNIYNEDQMRNAFIVGNLKKIRTAVSIAQGKIDALDGDNAREGIVEIRSYYLQQADEVSTAAFKATAELVAGWAREALVNGAGSKEPLKDDTGEIGTLDGSSVDSIYAIDMLKDLEGDDKKYRRLPSAKAWSGASASNITVGVGGNSVPAPVNAIDVVFVTKLKRKI